MNIQQQKNLLLSHIKNLITEDYVYLDFPGYFNVGDILIALGSWTLLENIPYRCIYRSTIGNFQYNKIPQNATIILQGGGNFGDLYPGANWFRNEIVKKFPNSKIIFFPQTITYKDSKKIIEDAAICAKHGNLHICARDNDSFALLNRYFSANKIYLLPDMALGLYPVTSKKNYNNKILLLRRKDFEIGDDVPELKNAYVKDWDDILNQFNFSRKLFLLKIINKLRKITSWAKLKDLSNYYLIRSVYPCVFNIAVNEFCKYKKIYSSRLHGVLLAKICQIPVEFFDTKYRKISGYYETWFDDKCNINE